MLMPGDEIRKLIEERNWTQSDLAKILNRPLQTVNLIIQGKKTITPEMAISLGAAFGTNPEKWMKLESDYRLSLAKLNADPVQKRAKLYVYAPIKDMERRGWIQQSNSVEEQEKIVCKFFNITSLDEKPKLNAAMRESIQLPMLTPAQVSWCFRAKNLARAIRINKFDITKRQQVLTQLRGMAAYPEEARNVPKILNEVGIRFLVVEPLPSSKVDGAAIWLDENSPVIVLSLRYDRIDAFWFTLMHEISHIFNGDCSVDDTLFGEGEQLPSAAKDDVERRADDEATAALVPPDKLQSFIIRVSPLYSKPRINQFANRLKIHPGIIVGQLQHRGEIGYSANREMLVKIREIIVSTALTDGWGHTINIDVN